MVLLIDINNVKYWIGNGDQGFMGLDTSNPSEMVEEFL